MDSDGPDRLIVRDKWVIRKLKALLARKFWCLEIDIKSDCLRNMIRKILSRLRGGLGDDLVRFWIINRNWSRNVDEKKTASFEIVGDMLDCELQFDAFLQLQIIKRSFSGTEIFHKSLVDFALPRVSLKYSGQRGIYKKSIPSWFVNSKQVKTGSLSGSIFLLLFSPDAF